VPVPSRPQKLGTYDVIAKIAAGGMATIYLGRTRSANGSEHVAAIKVLRHDLLHDEQAIRMFLDEAKILSRLSHPNIIRTLEYGTTGEHQFIAMELLVGRTLMDVWDTCAGQNVALRPELGAYIAARVADGLQYAHELTDERNAPLYVIHRDVNPSNIFLTYEGEVKLFDFGLAKSTGRSAHSQVGIIKGKLPYLSPEQIMQFPIDRRSDIFTLGTTLWEMTTMHRLFRRDSDVETVKAVRSAPIPDPRSLVQGYPDELARIVRRALERNREHRYATAAELARDLDAFLHQVARGIDMAALGPVLLDGLFPGDRARQVGWLRKTSTMPLGERTSMAPGVPLTLGPDSIPSPPPKKPRSR
jgi:serine/threonine protein kinase